MQYGRFTGKHPDFFFFSYHQESTRYTLRLRNQGGKTHNGDGGVTSVKGPDGTCFTFSACLLSFNGTNHIRGQLPFILYCKYGVSFIVTLQGHCYFTQTNHYVQWIPLVCQAVLKYNNLYDQSWKAKQEKV